MKYIPELARIKAGLRDVGTLAAFFAVATGAGVVLGYFIAAVAMAGYYLVKAL